MARGARPIFICHAGFAGVFAEYGFKEYQLPAPEELSDSDRHHYWENFIKRHVPHFNLSPADQIEAYVAPTWDAIIETAIGAEAALGDLLARLKPDAIVLDNVVMFPAVANAGCPWVRVVSCAETEIPDRDVPPYLSGLAADDREGRMVFERRYREAIAPIHDRYNHLRDRFGLAPLPMPLFLENSPYLNLLLAPEIVRHRRSRPLDPERFVYLEGCVRTDAPYRVPELPRDQGPLVYVSFGSLGAMDIDLLKRMIASFATMDARFLVSVGGFREAYRDVPDNVHLESWFPQPSVVAQSDLFIHHGGNNGFCEALRFAVPSLIMPYCWDGHDNARRAMECGVGRHLDRARWSEETLRATIEDLLGDATMDRRLRDNAEYMAARPGREAAADAILDLCR